MTGQSRRVMRAESRIGRNPAARRSSPSFRPFRSISLIGRLQGRSHGQLLIGSSILSPGHSNSIRSASLTGRYRRGHGGIPTISKARGSGNSSRLAKRTGRYRKAISARLPIISKSRGYGPLSFSLSGKRNGRSRRGTHRFYRIGRLSRPPASNCRSFSGHSSKRTGRFRSRYRNRFTSAPFSPGLSPQP